MSGGGIVNSFEGQGYKTKRRVGESKNPVLFFLYAIRLNRRVSLFESTLSRVSCEDK